MFKLSHQIYLLMIVFGGEIVNKERERLPQSYLTYKHIDSIFAHASCS
jgi:hypothetical protein